MATSDRSDDGPHERDHLRRLFGSPTLEVSGDRPRYAQIETRLRSLIQDRVLRAGDRLPTEKEVQDFFGVSRVTVRRAYGNLARDGLLRRRRGRGTEVNPPRIEVPIGAESSFSEAMEQQGFRLRTQVLADEMCAVTEEATRWFPEETSTVWHLERLRIVQDERIVHFQHYLPTRLRPTGGRSIGDSLYEYLDRLGVRPRRHRESLEAVSADAALAARLDIPVGAPLLRRIRVGSTAEGEVVEVSIGHYRGDRYRYVFDLGARGPSSS